MKILVTGDREWTDERTIETALRWAYNTAIERGGRLQVVHGDARGADRIAGQIAKELGAEVLPYPAQWDKHGRAAGPIRNRVMLAENSDVEIVLAFHPDLDNSRGTKDMVMVATKQNIPVRLYHPRPRRERTGSNS